MKEIEFFLNNMRIRDDSKINHEENKYLNYKESIEFDIIITGEEII